MPEENKLVDKGNHIENARRLVIPNLLKSSLSMLYLTKYYFQESESKIEL